MPVYEYECLKCGNRFEEIRQYSDAPITKHVGCGGKVKKLISASSFHLKGSGWYVTDYAKKGKDGEKKADSDAKTAEAKAESKKGEGKSEAKTESKTETKAETKTETKTESKSKETKTKN